MSIKAVGFRGKSSFGLPATESLVKTLEKDSAKILAPSVFTSIYIPNLRYLDRSSQRSANVLVKTFRIFRIRNLQFVHKSAPL
jgi:hypothetical protein